MEEIWGEDCKTFKLERWLKDGAFQPERPYKFPVFHAGPRMCLGKDMAIHTNEAHCGMSDGKVHHLKLWTRKSYQNKYCH